MPRETALASELDCLGRMGRQHLPPPQHVVSELFRPHGFRVGAFGTGPPLVHNTQFVDRAPTRSQVTKAAGTNLPRKFRGDAVASNVRPDTLEPGATSNISSRRRIPSYAFASSSFTTPS